MDRVADLCHQADLHWEEQLASMRHARAFSPLARAPAAAAPLRKAHQYADREGAGGLQYGGGALATTAAFRSPTPARQTTPGPRRQARWPS